MSYTNSNASVGTSLAVLRSVEDFRRLDTISSNINTAQESVLAVAESLGKFATYGDDTPAIRALADHLSQDLSAARLALSVLYATMASGMSNPLTEEEE